MKQIVRMLLIACVLAALGATPAAATTNNWTWPSEDPDGIQEPLLNVAGF
jgi:hypothetical protein